MSLPGISCSPGTRSMFLKFCTLCAQKTPSKFRTTRMKYVQKALFLEEHLRAGFGRAVTATQRVHGWRMVEWHLDIEVSCEISGIFPTNKQSRTNSGLSTRMQEAGGWRHHPH